MKAILCLFALFVAAAYAQTSCDPTAVVFNVDGSSSISDSNFNIVRQFLLDFSNLYDYSQSQIGLVQFSSSVQVEQGMTFTKSSFDNAVEKMVQLKASTKTGAGIDTSTSLLENLDSKYDRIIITVTDGFAKDDTTGPTNNAENNDITLVAVGLGDLITPAGLDDIASEPFASNVYLFTSFSDALTAVNTIYTQSVCKNTPTPPPPSGTCKIAVAFNVDGSSSISANNFDIVQQFLVDFGNSLNFPDSQAAIVQFSSTVQVETGFTSSKDTFNNAANNMVQLAASTRTGAGISQCTSLLDGVDNSYTKYIITVTDGAAKDDVSGPVDEAENQGITLFAIGLGDLVTESGLEQIASQPFVTYVYLFTQFSDALQAVDTILNIMCDTATPPPATPPPAPAGECDKLAVAFNVDGSSSISPSNFDIVRQFLTEFGDNLNFPTSQAAIVQFSSSVVVETDFTFDRDTFNNAANNMVQLSASTRTGAGITQCTDLLSSVDNSYTKYIVTLTDGAAKDEVSGPVSTAEGENITLFAIGLGDLVTQSGLDDLASQPFSTYVYLFTDFSDSLQVVDTILSIMSTCATPAPEPPAPAPQPVSPPPSYTLAPIEPPTVAPGTVVVSINTIVEGSGSYETIVFGSASSIVYSLLLVVVLAFAAMF